MVNSVIFDPERFEEKIIINQQWSRPITFSLKKIPRMTGNAWFILKMKSIKSFDLRFSFIVEFEWKLIGFIIFNDDGTRKFVAF